MLATEYIALRLDELALYKAQFERGFYFLEDDELFFIPEGETRTFSEMNADEKNAMSHRGKAIRKMMESLGV